MEKYVIGKDERGRDVVSDKAPRNNINIGGYVAEDGTPLVTVGDLIIGQLPDLATTLVEVERGFRLRDAMSTIKELA